MALSRAYGVSTAVRSACSASCPIDVHTSVASTSTPAQACAGSSYQRTLPPVSVPISAAVASTAGSGR